MLYVYAIFLLKGFWLIFVLNGRIYSMKHIKMLLITTSVVLFAVGSQSAEAFFIDGEGHYAVKGQIHRSPGFSDERASRNVFKQSFRVLGKIKPTDVLDLNMGLRLFEDPELAYLGDRARPNECSWVDGDQNSPFGSNRDCVGRHQDTGEPGYEPYRPFITELYVRYAMDACILEVGRRSRHWGLGIFLNSGKRPFDTTESLFDGVSCSVNVQKNQTVGFTLGMDKLVESGTSIDVETAIRNRENPPPRREVSANDINQFFTAVEYDDTHTGGSGFKRIVGIYFAFIKGGSATDIKFADLYTAFFFDRFSFKNEILFRLGKSADPSWSRYGGLSSRAGDEIRNNVASIALAGELEYVFSKTGALLGPREYNEGNIRAHSMFFEYAYAPGSSQGYLAEYDGNKELREAKASAVAFNRNYKPGLILFNSYDELSNLRVDGIFDPGRVMNVTVFGVGYRYQNTSFGNIEVKLLNAQLNEGMSAEVRAQNSNTGLIGYGGTNLGYELNTRYSKEVGKYFEYGADLAIALPGDAWKLKEGHNRKTGYLLQGNIAFKF
jgi:hypothetical protein